MSMERKDLKWDKGKLQYMLILPRFLRGMAQILTLGEENHPKVKEQPSWQLVEPEAYENALTRHFQETRINPGSVDNDMKTSHYLHIAVNAMFLWWFESQRGHSAPNVPTSRGGDEE